MPIYEYECSRCHYRFDRRQDFHDEPIALCPNCQAKAKRVIHSVAVIYKGSGFYTTDYARKDNASNPKEPEKPAEKEQKKAVAETPSPVE